MRRPKSHLGAHCCRPFATSLARRLVADDDSFFRRIVLYGWQDVGLGQRPIRRRNISLCHVWRRGRVRRGIGLWRVDFGRVNVWRIGTEKRTDI